MNLFNLPPGRRAPLSLAILLASFAMVGNAQTVTNGSATGTVGNSMLQYMAGWLECDLPPNNSPDVCDMTVPSWIGLVTVPAAPSPDGGSWIGLANGVNPIEQECAIGEMTGLVPGVSYQLRFWGACFGTGNGNYANGTPVVLTVTIGAAVQDFTIPMVALEWNIYSMCFVAQTETMNFTLQTFSGGGYGSFDGFIVEPSTGSIDLLPDTTLCDGATLLLDATVPNGTYEWQDGSTAATFLVQAPGTYWVMINTLCGPATDTVHVTGITGESLDLGPDIILCTGESSTITPNIAGISYLWQDNSTSATYTASQAGVYWVDVETACGTLRDSVNVSITPPPNVDLGADDSFCLGSEFPLNASTPGGSYQWMDGSISAVYLATSEGLYWVDVTVDGCSARDSILLTTIDCAVELEMPNVFSPNGDGSNDIFLPALIRGITSSTLTIYNRWGQVVFTNTDVRQGWNGRIDGTPCPEGTYFWLVKFRGALTDWMEQSGHVTVVR